MWVDSGSLRNSLQRLLTAQLGLVSLGNLGHGRDTEFARTELHILKDE